MGHKHDHDEILDAAVGYALTDGLGRLTFGNLAKHMGIADRTIVYYFPTKAQLIDEVAAALGLRLMEVLDAAFGEAPLPRAELLRRAWPMLIKPKADAVFRVFFELTGLAASGAQPYTAVVAQLMQAWIDWLSPKIVSDDSRADALAIIATLDGLLLVRHTAGKKAATQAASALGVA